MSGLRDQLESKAKAWQHERGDLYYASQELLGLLAAHPVEPECGAVDRSGQRRCVFTPGHHEVENWTSHGDRGGWTWNDQPAEAKS